MLICVAVLAACSSGSSPDESPATSSGTTAAPSPTTSEVVGPIPSTLFGMQPVGLTATTSPKALGGVTPASGIGSVFLLDQGGEWFSVQPSADATPDTSYIEAATQAARSRGLTDVHVILTGTPEWAAEGEAVPGEPLPHYGSPPRDIAAWETYVRAVATALKGKATSYQVWSEANLRTRWHGSPQQLADLSRAAYDVIKEIDPAAQVVAASTTVRLDDLDRWYRPFLAALAADGWPVDAFSAHFYPPGDGTPVTRQELIGKVQQALTDAGAPDRPLWDGEVNYGVAGPTADSPHQVLDNMTGAGYVVRTYLDALRFGLSRVYWSAWTEKNPVYGVTMWPGYPGPKAQRTAYAWLADKWWRDCVTDAEVVTCTVSATSDQASPDVTIVWSEGDVVRTKVPRGVTEVCGSTGVCRSVEAGDRLVIDGAPVRLSG